MKSFLFLFLCCTSASWGELLFYHIPKSAGSSIETVLGYNYPIEQHFRIYTSQSISPYGEEWVEDPFYFFQKLSDKKIPLSKFSLSKDSFVFGHIYFKDGFKHFPLAKNVTFLRDPIKRLISHQKYWEICRDYYPSSRVNKSHVIPEGEPINVAHNLQVYYLSSFSRDDPEISLKEHLESAKQNLLNHFDFVGITEYFEASMQALFSMLGLKDLPEIPVVNQFSFKKLEISNEKLEELHRLNWADCELYSFAKKLFVEKYKNVSVKVEKEKKVFLDKIDYSFDQPIKGGGWGYRELSGSSLDFCRTSFIKNAWIDFDLQKKSYSIRILAGAPLQKNISDLKLMANDFLIPLKHESAGPWALLEGVIPKEAIHKGKTTRFTFSVPELYNPSDHGQILDDRDIGLTVTRIQVQPIN